MKDKIAGERTPLNARQSLWPNYSPPEDLVFTHGIGSELFSKDGDS